MTVREFVESEYLVHAEASLAKSTVAGYKKIWRTCGKHFDGRSLDLRTCDCQAIMRAIAAENPTLSKTSLQHTKNFFSGVFTHALRMGQLERDSNPWQAVAIPMAPPASETHAYSPAEIETILKSTPAPYDLVVLVAACAGLRKSEIRGLRWSDWDATTSTLTVNRAFWGTHEKTTKSAASKAPVFVVPVLADRLNAAKPRAGSHSKPIFPSSTGTPLDLDNLARRVIIPAVGSTWRGWHAFRRGLATFLHAKGIPDKEIQAVLRHENVSITQKSYVKTVAENVRKAMANVSFGGNGTATAVTAGNATSETWTSPRGDDTLQQ